jgi:hypothetical protein
VSGIGRVFEYERPEMLKERIVGHRLIGDVENHGLSHLLDVELAKNGKIAETRQELLPQIDSTVGETAGARDFPVEITDRLWATWLADDKRVSSNFPG